MDLLTVPSLIAPPFRWALRPELAPPPGIDPGPWASKAHVLATTQWRNTYSLVWRAYF